MNSGPTRAHALVAIDVLEAEMTEDEKKVLAVMKDDGGKLSVDEIDRRSGVPWLGGRLSDALYGLERDRGLIKQEGTDLSTCTFSILKK